MPLATPSPRRLGRRRALAAAAALPLLAPGPAYAMAEEWAAFRRRFVAADGRVVDTGNANVSHSEGQGWALLFAVRAGDLEGFGRILAWTRRTLRRPRDHLHAWRFRPDAAVAVEDPNNATDGDICIAWALVEAGQRWGIDDYTALGTAIAQDILRLLVRRAGAYSVLLPGARGFERPGATILNPSYYVFPAFEALAQAVPDPAWVRLAADGLTLLRAARFGRWGLPPDWILLGEEDGRVSLPQDWPPRFSFDAVRVPLYMIWAGLPAEPAVAGAREFWTDPRHPYRPAWADVSTNLIAPYAAPAGIESVARLATAARPRLAMPATVAEAADYYSAALSLLTRSAVTELQGRNS